MLIQRSLELSGNKNSGLREEDEPPRFLSLTGLIPMDPDPRLLEHSLSYFSQSCTWFLEFRPIPIIAMTSQVH